MAKTNWDDFTPVNDKGESGNSVDWSQFEPVAETPKPGIVRSMADTAVAAGRGVSSGVKMVADSFGANNKVSRVAGKAADAIGDLGSDYSKEQQATAAQRMKDAEATGSGFEELKAGVQNFADRPIDSVVEGLGSSLPTIAAMALSRGKINPVAAGAGAGAVQGVGAVKGQIYDEVQDQHLQAGATPEIAEQQAQQAQAYRGPNTDQLALGAGLGAVAGSTGVEAGVSRILAGSGKSGFIKSMGAGIAKEAPMEFAQGGQEKLAANIASQREGFDVPTMQGVVGQGTMEGLAGGGSGAAVGAVEGLGARRQAERAAAERTIADPNAGALTKAAATGVLTGANEQKAMEAAIQGAAEQADLEYEKVTLQKGKKELSLAPEQQDADGIPFESTATLERKAVGLENLQAYGSIGNPFELGYLHAQLPKLNTKGRSYTIIPHVGGGYTLAPTKALTPAILESVAALQPQPRGQTMALPAPDSEMPNGRMIADDAGGVAPETYAEAQRAAQGQKKQTELGKQAPRGVNPSPNVRKPLLPLANEKVAQTLANSRTEKTGEQHTVIPHPTVQGKFAVVPVSDPSIIEAPARTIQSERDKRQTPKAKEILLLANEAATSPKNDLPEPTQAQKEAGNYKKAHINLHGLDISIENPQGSTRSGIDPNGKQWSNILANHYGYIKRTTGADGDQVDAFIGGNPDSDKVFVIDQVEPTTGKFDEHKVMVGFDSAEAAKAAYQANYAKDWKGGKSISETSVAGFKTWLKDGDTKKPYAKTGNPVVEQNQAVAEPAKPQPDRRQDTATRKTVDDMTPEEMRRALLVDDMTGLGNKRAYNEVNKKPYQASIDIDSLKWINDNMGHASGDKLIELIGQALKDERIDAYHISGDEFVAQFDGEQEGDSALQRVRDRLRGAVIEYTAQDGTVTIKNGVEFSYGIAETIDAADERLGQDKARREASGERAGRGQEPLGVAKRPAQGREDHQSDTAAEEVTPPAKADSPGLAKLKSAKAKKESEKAAAKAASPGLKKLQEAKAAALSKVNEADFIHAPDGSLNFGEITEDMAKAMKRQSGGIRLQQGVQNADGTGYGLAHIEANHGKDIRNAGFESVEKFIASVAKNFNQVWQATKTRQLLVAVRGERQDVMFVQLEPADEGDFYRVNTAFPAQESYFGRQEKKGIIKLWDGSEPASVVAGQQPAYAAETPDETSSQGSPTARGQSDSTVPQKERKGNSEKIEDIGEKIGGARKDVWTSFKDKMDVVADDDIAAEPLSKSWPAPDYQALLESGVDPWTVAFMHAARDAIPSKPRAPYKVRAWAELVKDLRRHAMSLINGDMPADRIKALIEKMGNDSRAARDIAGRIDLYLAVGHEKSLEGITLQPHFYSLYKGRENVSLWAVEQKTAATAFSNWPKEIATGATKEEAIDAFKARYDTLNADKAAKQPSFDIFSERGTDGYFVGKKIGRNFSTLAGPFATVKEARQYRDKNNADLTAKLDKLKEIPRERRDVNNPRVGQDMRGAQDVTPQMFAETFGFRGVEFGNWVGQGKRQQDLNESFDALMDMAAVLGVPPKAISLNGELGLAFGARGSGGVNPASAHYEPGKVVINLTKRAGAGSLGHEWFHALDNYFSRLRTKGGDFMTTALDVSLAARGSNYVANTAVRKEMIDAFGAVVKAIKSTALKARSSKLDAKRSKEYWTTGEEMAARAFESYLISKLHDQNASNDYLANIVAPETWAAAESMGFELDDSYPYPTAGEMPVIRAGFDHFFQTIESKETDSGVMLFNAGEPNLTGTGIDGKLLSQVIQGASTTDILNTIAKDSKNPQFREMAQALIAHGINSSVELGSSEGKRFKVKSVENAAFVAAYAPKRDAVLLFGASNLDRHLIHEFMHAASYKALRKNGLAAGQLRSLYSHVKQTGQLDGQYGMENIDEFLAEAFSNEDFQDKLQALTKMPSGSKFKNAWDAFVSLIRRVLGLPESMETALDQVMRIGRAVMVENQAAVKAEENGELLGSRVSIIGDNGRNYTPEQLAAFRNIGREVKVPTIKDRISNLWKDAGKKAAQGLVDQFHPIKDLSSEAYSLMRLSKGSSGAFEVMLNGGQLKLTDDVYDFDETKAGGVVDKLLKPLQGESDDFMWWVAANRAEKLSAEDKEHLFTDADIQATKSLNTGTTTFDYTLQHGVAAGTVTRDRSTIYRDALKTFNDFHKNALDMAEQSGLIDGASRPLWESEFYVPFYRVSEEDDAGVRGMNIKSGVVRQQAFKKLKGGSDKLNSDLLDNTLMNWAHLLDAAAKNRGAKSSLEAAASMGVATETNSVTKNTVWFMENGQKRYFSVNDPYVLTAIQGLEFAGMKGPLMEAMGTMKHMLTMTVTASPFFKVRNLIRDSVQAIGTSPLSYNVAGNLREGFSLTNKKNAAYMRLLAGGGTIHFGTMMEGSESRRVRSLVASGVDESTILNNEAAYKRFYKKVIAPSIDAYNELGNRGEAINRAALYNQLITQGKSHAEASLMARDLMDFSMQGAWTGIRFLTQVVPFMNARMQGLYKLGRAAKEDPAKFGVVLGAVATASIALMLAYSDDDDWKKREDWDRDGFWWFKIGGLAYRIPKPFEIGAIGTLAERGVEYFTNDEMTGERFGKRLGHLLADNLSMNPTPQLIKPILDVYANKDSFTGRPIETMGMERMQSDYRFTQRTSMTARGISTAGNAVSGGNFASPVQVDHLIRGYFGWLGSFIVATADKIARPATGQISGAAPDYWKVATGGMIANAESPSSRYVSQMYEQAKVLEEAYGTHRMLIREGKTEEAREYAADNREKLNRYKQAATVKRAESKLNERIRMIERSSKSSDEKRELIQQIQRQKDLVARRIAS